MSCDFVKWTGRGRGRGGETEGEGRGGEREREEGKTCAVCKGHSIRFTMV